MNDRIWEIIEQADDEGGDDPDIRDELLVKLVVEECLNLVDRGGEFVSRPKMVERLREHFGVEE